QGRREALLLQPGDSGLEVERLQAALKAQGVYAGPVDGRFTEEVRAAVLRLQQDKGLRADGVAGPATLKELGLY
ncbi:MAG: peptidoglycan-binding protein, partial [Candidatus Methylomirabilis sp.]|nr:peptidoglycan-binding protein [Deltaproteobacteria bacterium]